MAKLADIDSEIRIFLKIAAAAAAVVFLIYMVVAGGKFFKELFFPTPPPPPEERFGVLPSVAFPKSNATDLTFQINTLTGKLPTTGTLPGEFPDRMTVYKVKMPPPSLVALQNARNAVGGGNYNLNETKLSEANYRWSNKDGTTIQYNIVNNNFKIFSNFLASTPSAQLSSQANDKDSAYLTVINFLTSIGEDTSDIDQSKTISTYLSYQDGNLVQAQSQSDADFIRIDLFQKDINGSPIYYPTVGSSIMHFILGGGGDNGNPIIVDASFDHYIPDKNGSTYPIKTANEAFSDLQKGNAFIYYQGNSSTVDVTDVSRGYYISSDNPEYFVPIVVFKGTSLTSYVLAVP